MADDPLSDVFNVLAAPLAGTIRSVEQFRSGVDEFLRGVENFNRTMENLNDTAERINVLLGEVEEPLRAAIPQVTRTVKTADEVMQVVSGPAIAVAPGLTQLAEALSNPAINQLPNQLAQFSDVLNELTKRLGPLSQIAGTAGGLFGGLRFPGVPGRPEPTPAEPDGDDDEPGDDPAIEVRRAATTARKKSATKKPAAKKKSAAKKKAAAKTTKK
ncbi:MAG: hypothetical protein AAGA42_03160 [Actinomycetota bacterium]